MNGAHTDTQKTPEELRRLVLALLEDLERLQQRAEQAERALRPFLAHPRWLSIGSFDNTAEVRVSRSVYEKARAVLAAGGTTPADIKHVRAGRTWR